MLGLPQQVGGAHLGVGGVVGDNQRLGGAGEQVDADTAEELAFGLGDEGVAGADQHVHRGNAGGAERHCRHCLDAAQQVNLVGAGEMHGGDGGGGRHAVQRRRAGGDPLHARDLGGEHRHVRRCHHRIAAARHITTDLGDGNIAMAKTNAGQRLDFHVA